MRGHLIRHKDVRTVHTYLFFHLEYLFLNSGMTLYLHTTARPRTVARGSEAKIRVLQVGAGRVPRGLTPRRFTGGQAECIEA